MSWFSEQPFYVYLISAEGYVKIGITSQIVTRVQSLQHNHWARLELVHVHGTTTRDEAAAIESLAHAQLSQFWVRGEWFMVSVEEAVRAINEGAARAQNGERVKFDKQGAKVSRALRAQIARFAPVVTPFD